MIYSCYNRRRLKPVELTEHDKTEIIKMILADLGDDESISQVFVWIEDKHESEREPKMAISDGGE